MSRRQPNSPPTLREFREGIGLTQKAVGAIYHAHQVSIGRVEARDFDRLLLSTIARYVAACGFGLEVVAVRGRRRHVLARFV